MLLFRNNGLPAEKQNGAKKHQTTEEYQEKECPEVFLENRQKQFQNTGDEPTTLQQSTKENANRITVFISSSQTVVMIPERWD